VAGHLFPMFVLSLDFAGLGPVLEELKHLELGQDPNLGDLLAPPQAELHRDLQGLGCRVSRERQHAL
jgi:hypothetical protein